MDAGGSADALEPVTATAEVNPTESGAFDGLSFLDLIYAIPVGDIATRVSGTRVSRIPLGTWASIVLCRTVTIFSWIGLHQNRALMRAGAVSRISISATKFLSPRFAQFGLEIVIVGLYFVMGTQINIPRSGQKFPDPDLPWLTGFLVVVFASYLVWDLLDAYIGRSDADTRLPALVRARATCGAVVVFGLSYGAVRLWHPHGQHPALVWCVLSIVGLYAYRVAQERMLATLH